MISLLLTWPGLSFSAGETNATPSAARPPSEIFSDSLEADLETRTAVYIGNVRVIDPRMNLTADELTVKVPAEGGRPERMVADGNVTILAIDDEGRTNRAWGNSLVYTYNVQAGFTNEVLELTGTPETQPKLETSQPQMTMTGDVVVWDRARNKIYVKNHHTEAAWEPPAKTNHPPATGESRTPPGQ